ncbi:sugar ABC transporter substrate-binding protein [Bifidobacterium pongonis]|uniref:sugar ABC transporter substrate-binding protein n=1 Tax=Bifidobacterium pongonis TaxID=2834432 RepID=UPI001C5777B8|nr:sugar ABC transporter substrate-binding protein [Bifidobacterium pongonis]
MRSFVRRAGAVLLAVALMPLASCAPAGAAVGDAGSGESAVRSTGVERNDVSIGMVGSQDASADGLVLDAYDHAGLGTSYVQLRNSNDSVRDGEQAVRDLATRQVTLIIVGGIDASRDAEGWNDALRGARAAGIPVVLLNPVHEPSDKRLFAASFTVNDRATDAMPIDKATMLVINDRPHERNLMVSTLTH